MDPITLVILIALGAFVAGFAFSPTFRNKVLTTLRIRSGKALDNATTAGERAEDSYKQQIAKAKQLQADIASVVGRSNLAKKDLTRLQSERDAAKADYALVTKTAGASEAAKNTALDAFTKADAKVKSQETRVIELGKSADDSRKALETVQAALQQMAAKVDDIKGNEELTAVLKGTADALQSAKDIKSGASAIGEAARQADEELEKARAAAELARGSQGEQELDDIRKANEREEARKKLEAELGGGSK